MENINYCTKRSLKRMILKKLKLKSEKKHGEVSLLNMG